MAAFSPAQYDTVINDLKSGLNTLSTKLGDIGPTSNQAAGRWYVTELMAQGILWCANKVIEIGEWILEKIIELMEGVGAPFIMFVSAKQWQDVRSTASSVAGELKVETLPAPKTWFGTGAAAYGRQVKPQADAANRLGILADKVSVSLGVCAAAGAAFYIALGVIVIKFIIAMIAVIAAFESVAFSWAGAALMVEEAGVNTTMIVAAVTTLVAMLTTQASQMAVIHGEAREMSNFGTQWPDAAPDHFGDATVTDGDADWSLNNQ